MTAGPATVVGLPGPVGSGGAIEQFVLHGPGPWTRPQRPISSRRGYAAAHVVPAVWGDNTPGAPAVIDWDQTLAIRHEIWSYGLGVADAMDTAQRGMGLDWPGARELIRRSGRDAAAVGGMLACGAGTDQVVLGDLPPGRHALTAIVDAYREQVAVVRDAGATVILMASRALAAVAGSAQDYLDVYRTVLDEVDQPVILHWLGDMFDPALAGYWGSSEIPTATGTFSELLTSHAEKIDGVKVSLLDADHEIGLRRSLPPGVRLYTGDDFNYPELIVGDGGRHSDALLGIFAAIYPAASTALQALDAGDDAGARRILDSTQALSRHLFAAPTRFYKTGIALLSWLNGHQRGFDMIGGLASGRSLAHAVTAFRLADRGRVAHRPRAGRTPDRAAARGPRVDGMTSTAPARLSLNTATTKNWTLREAVDGAARAGLHAVGLWRDRVAEVGTGSAAAIVRDAGLRVSSLCRGGFLTAADRTSTAMALDDNRAAIDEAAELGAPVLVMVVGGLPPGDRDLAAARERVGERIAELVPYARQRSVQLALEPLHPMYCADRAVISTLKQALDLAADHPAADVGVVVDSFHTWWDPELPAQIQRAGAEGRIASYQVCDWNLPIASDALLSRGMMGDGFIDFAALTRWVDAAGYRGDIEVEIFSADIWARDGDTVLDLMIERYRELVEPFLAG